MFAYRTEISRATTRPSATAMRVVAGWTLRCSRSSASTETSSVSNACFSPVWKIA